MPNEQAVLRPPSLNVAPAIYWMREREKIRTAKEHGEPPPWTEDESLSRFKFCCVRREDDYTTRWIAQHIRQPFADHPNLWLMCCIARLVNLPWSLVELIADNKAWPHNDGWSPEALGRALDARAARGEKIVSDAYIVANRTAGGLTKGGYIARVVGELWDDRRQFEALFRVRPTMEAVFRHLHRHNGLGGEGFLPYQMVVDMRFTPLLENAPDRQHWAVAGKGTRRGLNRLRGRPVKARMRDQDALRELRTLYAVLREDVPEIEIDFSDVPNICCEVDKYLRLKNGDGIYNRLYTPRA